MERFPRQFTVKQAARLLGILVVALLAILASTNDSKAAIIVIDLGPTGFDIAGVNGGVSADSSASLSNFPFSGAGTLDINNAPGSQPYYGLAGSNGLAFAFLGFSSPEIFALNAPISGAASYFTDNLIYTLFRTPYAISSDFGPGSYMGFRTAQGNYGWLEVTWNMTSNEFQILSGAYQDQIGVAILAGDTSGAAVVPEPGTWAAAALLAGGVAFARLRRRAKVS